MQISIFHNIMWPKYKAGVFSALNDLTQGTSTKVTFTQIAETDGERIALGSVDLSYHRYPYELIFPGAYNGVPTFKRVTALVARAWNAQADIVVLPGYERIEYWAMLAILLVRRKPRAVFCDSTAFDRPQRLLKALAKRAFFACCDGFFAYGSRSRDYLMQHGVPAEKIFFKCQAAALPHHYDEQSAFARRVEAAPRAGEPPRFLYVGRLSPEKGLDTLLTAFAELLATHSQARLALVGAGPLKESLQATAARMGLSERVDLLGSMGIDQLAEQYAGATALVLPSTSEPWGLVVNEAMSHGCPVIASHVCGCVPELIDEGHTGFVFEAGQVTELAEKMRAAAAAFQDAPATAQTCIARMRQFMPASVARQIQEGCTATLLRLGRHA